VKKFLLTTASVAAFILPAQAHALTFFGGHGYEFVSDNVSWHQALANSAAATPLAGYTAHLVTITSAAEDAFLKTLTGNAVYVWAAGTDAGLEGTWKWAAGPEAGQTFYVLGATAQPGFSNWNAGEPNNSGSENYLHFKANAGDWNDIFATFPSGGYVVEYSSNAAVPEPASWALMIAGFGLVGSAMRRRKPSVSVSFA
jgi:PEP-CTERM motif/Lectin C-type domain